MHHRCRHLESHLLLQDALQVCDLNWDLSVEQLVLDAIAGTLMKLHMPSSGLARGDLLLRILGDARMKSLHLIVRDSKTLSNLLKSQTTLINQIGNASQQLGPSLDHSLLRPRQLPWFIKLLSPRLLITGLSL